VLSWPRMSSEPSVASGAGEFSVYGSGAWSGGRPILWIRAGAGAAAVGYALVAVYSFLHTPPSFADRLGEALVVLAAVTAFLLARRRPPLASALLLAAVGLEALASMARGSTLGFNSLLALQPLVLAAGLLFGGRVALGVAAAVVLLTPAAVGWARLVDASVPPLGGVASSRLVVFELVTAAIGLLTWLAFRTFTRVLAAAEERRALEQRLQHLQRLELVGMLTGGFAHDFKNVLGVVRGVAGALPAASDEEAREIALALDQASASGLAAVRQLLDVSRREEPRQVVTDLAEAVAGLQRMAGRLLGPRHRLEVALEGPAPAVVDPTQVEQVLLNLAANARDAVPRGGTVRVAVRALDAAAAAALGSILAAGRQVLVEVRDEGPGVPPELRERIFEPFVTTKARGEGSGLGLATVRAIALAVGGCVTVASPSDGGAAFRWFLPLVRAEGTG